MSMLCMSIDRLPTEQFSKTLSLLIIKGSFPNLNSIIRLSNSKWSSCCNRHWFANELSDRCSSVSWFVKWIFWIWMFWRRCRSSDGPFCWIFWWRRMESKRKRMLLTLQELSMSVTNSSESWILFGSIQGSTKMVLMLMNDWKYLACYLDTKLWTWYCIRLIQWPLKIHNERNVLFKRAWPCCYAE